jgi:uncharacterized membrane protein
MSEEKDRGTAWGASRPGASSPAEDDGSDVLEALMQKISRVVSVLGLGAMASGFVVAVISGAPLHLPGSSAASLGTLVSSGEPISLIAMSGGIILLALLPAIRVLLALLLYLRTRQLSNNLVALAVLLELVFSTIAGG